MELIDLRLTRVVIHEVFQRTNERVRRAPIYSNNLEHLDGEAIDALRNRIVTAMDSPAKCLQMAIDKTGNGSMFALAVQLVDSDDALFVERSKQTADLLTDAQMHRKIPGGIFIAFTGSAGVPPRRLLGIIKAEVHNGFRRELANGAMTLRFLRDLLLTAQTKLYKIGLFVEATPNAVDVGTERWQAFIYDETLTLANRDGAAQYFYEGFLGCKFLESSARNTKKFHDLTKAFIRVMDIPEVERISLNNALVTYLRADQSPTVSTTVFSSTYLSDADTRDAYERHMQAGDFPMGAVAKDLTDINSALRLRKLTFRNQVRLIAPAESFDDLVVVEPIDGDIDQHGNRDHWTRLTIKSDISGQE
jgi:hypothetical protein